MQKFFLKLSLLLAPIFILAWLLVNKANGAIEFNTIEHSVSEALLQDQNVAFSINFDDAMLQKYHIESLKNKIQVLILGSSRSMKIDKEFFPEQSFFNSSVKVADLEDDISIYQVYRENNHLPTTVIIGLDPWILNKNNDSRVWLPLSQEFLGFLKNLPSGNLSAKLWYYVTDIRNLYSPENLQNIVKKMIRNLVWSNNSDKYLITKDSENFFPVLHSDGSVAESLKIRSKTTAQVEQEITSSDGLCPGQGQIYENLSADKKLLLTIFIQQLKKDNVNVIFWLPPFHPLAYASISKNKQCSSTLAAEVYFRKIAANNNIKMIGSYNPGLYNLSGNDFYDASHPKRTALEKIFKKDGLIK